MKEKQQTNLDGIPELARDVAKNLKGGEILALIGDLGSGKTTFTKALAKQLKVKETVSSPTFIICNRFEAKLSNKKKVFLNHLDLYRTKNFTELKALGLPELWSDKKAVTIIEWADKIKRHLPTKTRFIYFKEL